MISTTSPKGSSSRPSAGSPLRRIELVDPPAEPTDGLARVGAELVARFGRPDAAGTRR